jgi:ribosomal protein S18 acetylase RimI-like enzyme
LQFADYRMPPLPADAPPDVVVAAVERCWRAGVRTFGLAPITSIRDDSELFWYVTGLPDAAFNSVMYANLAPDRVDAAVDELFRLRETHDVPIGWLVGPSSRPLDLPERLLTRGLQHHVDLTPMTLVLASLPAEAAPTPGLTIEPVTSPEVLEEWIVAETRGFESTGALASGLAALRRGMGIGHGLPLYHLLGRLHGVPVATATVLLAGGIAGIYDVSAVPDARRRGIGTAMTLAALQVARTHEYEIAFLQPSAMGRSMYERLGFRVCGVCGVYG